jgi:hypothetical protein
VRIALLGACCLLPTILVGQEALPRVMAAPQYSGVAIAAGVSGNVSIKVQVAPAGGVRLLEVTGHVLLRQNSQDAAKKWTFDPSSAGTKQVITFIFRLLPAKAPAEDEELRFVSPLTVEVSKRLPDVQHLP